MRHVGLDVTHTRSHAHTNSPVICLPHPAYSRSTSANYCVFVRKSRTRQARSTRGAIKHESGAKRTFSQTSEQCISIAAISRIRLLICIPIRCSCAHCVKPKVPGYLLKDPARVRHRRSKCENPVQISRHDRSNKTFHPIEILLSPLLAASLMESTGSSGEAYGPVRTIGGLSIVTRFTWLSHCSGGEVGVH